MTGTRGSRVIRGKSGRRAPGLGGLCTVLVFAGLVVLLGAAGAAAATGGSEFTTGELALRAELSLNSTLGGCSPPQGVDECAARTGSGLVPGLGAVSEKYEFLVGLGPPSCAVGSGEALASSSGFVVAGKGEIHFALAEGGCISQEEPIYNQTQAYTITGGTGIYAGASGSGTVERRLGGTTATGRNGTETWKGTLSVPGLEFDTTRPTITGATNKTVRAAKHARTARVRFTVTAQDDKDGVVPVKCTPRSGSRFRIGRTRVTCEATDASANTAAASFTVTVRARK
jgi:HYR domain